MRIRIRRRPPTASARARTGQRPAHHRRGRTTTRFTLTENLLAGRRPGGSRWRSRSRPSGSASSPARRAARRGAARPTSSAAPIPRRRCGRSSPPDGGDDPDPAPAILGEVVACALVLRDPPYLPLRPFRDDDVDPERSAQRRPAARHPRRARRPAARLARALPARRRPAPRDWARPTDRLAIERPLAAEVEPAHAAHGSDECRSSPCSLWAGWPSSAAWQAYGWYLRGGLAAPGARRGGAVGRRSPRLAGLARSAGAAQASTTPELVRREDRRPAFAAPSCGWRSSPPGTDTPWPTALGVRGPLPPLRPPGRQPPRRARPPAAEAARGRGLAAAPRADPLARRARDLLSTRELAGLWHLPRAGADVALVERTTARQRLPLPRERRGAAAASASRAATRVVPVHVPVPDDSLRQNALLLVAKTRAGKSTLLVRHRAAPDGGTRTAACS